MQMYVNEDYLFGLYDELSRRFKSIEIDENNRYSILKKTVIERFLEYGTEDIRHGQYERAVYMYNCIRRLTGELEAGKDMFWDENPEANGAKVSGFSMINAKGRPVLYCGYGHFAQVRKDIAEMKNFGCNTIQIEIGPSYILNPPGSHAKWNMDKEETFKDGEIYGYDNGEFEVNYAVIKKDIIPVLEQAYKENVAVCLLLSPHYIPRWYGDKYPEIKSKNIGFLKYNIYHPKVKKMLEIYLKTVVSAIKDYPALQSICISNEPAFNPVYDCRDEEVINHDLLPTEEKTVQTTNLSYQWQEFLKEKFHNIGELNKLTSKNYKDFSEVKMPEDEDDTPIFYQWHLWNNRSFADWHKWVAQIVKSIAPNIPVHAKFMPVFGSSDTPYHRRFVKYGIDPEQFCEFTDFSGCDAWSFEGRSHLPLSYKLEWYDYLTSLKCMPIDNSEDHVIEDGDTNYSDIQAKRIYADMWQGAIHGRTLNQLWVWERSYDPQRATVSGSILNRPDCVEAVGRASLDLNRLAYEVTAMQNCKRRAAILFSKPSRVYNINYTTELFRAYEGMLYAGLRPYFITEENIEKLNDFEFLVVAGATNVYKKTILMIEKYIKENHKVIIVDSDKSSLGHDEYNCSCENAQIYSNAIWIDTSYSTKSPDEGISKKVTDCINSIIKREVFVLPKDSDSYNIEWNYSTLNGRKLINICSYANFDRVVKIVNTNGKIQELKNLITAKTVPGDTIVLESYTPQLLELIEEKI